MNHLLCDLDSLRSRCWAWVEMQKVYWGLTFWKEKGENGIGRQSVGRIVMQIWQVSQPNGKPGERLLGLGESCVVYSVARLFTMVLLSHWLMVSWEGHDLGAKTEADTKELTPPRLAAYCTRWHWIKGSFLKGSLSGTSPCSSRMCWWSSFLWDTFILDLRN